MRVARLQADGLLVDARFLPPLALATIDHGQPQVGVDAVGLPAERLEQRDLRVGEAALALEHAAEPRAPAGARGIEPGRTRVGAHRLAVAPLPLEHEPEATVE